MVPGDATDRFSAMEDPRLSRTGLINFVVLHLVLLAVFAFWYLTQGGGRIAGLPTAVWVTVAALPVVWLQFWYFIRTTEVQLEEDRGREGE
ncbi:hypothetical protein ACFQE1_02355 [Halobium palmae]|uniref:2TM domain-containing protein n=1 Tax=Halobium palmae TaxID=1776492 RepID=A0ABD5RWD6_9EURY